MEVDVDDMGTLLVLTVCVGVPLWLLGIVAIVIAQGQRQRAAARRMRRLVAELRAAVGDQDLELARAGMRWPVLLCLRCGARWFSNGRTECCKVCGDDVGLVLATPTVLGRLDELQHQYGQLLDLVERYPSLRLARTD